MLARDDKAVDIRPATESEHAFLRDNFDLLFPPSDPLDRSTFHALAKLVLVRRIIKAPSATLAVWSPCSEVWPNRSS